MSSTTATGPAIVVGVPSASEAVEGRIPAARYNEYAIAPDGDGWRVEMVGRSVAADRRTCLGKRAAGARGSPSLRAR